MPMLATYCHRLFKRRLGEKVTVTHIVGCRVKTEGSLSRNEALRFLLIAFLGHDIFGGPLT